MLDCEPAITLYRNSSGLYINMSDAYIYVAFIHSPHNWQSAFTAYCLPTNSAMPTFFSGLDKHRNVLTLVFYRIY